MIASLNYWLLYFNPVIRSSILKIEAWRANNFLFISLPGFVNGVSVLMYGVEIILLLLEQSDFSSSNEPVNEHLIIAYTMPHIYISCASDKAPSACHPPQPFNSSDLFFTARSNCTSYI